MLCWPCHTLWTANGTQLLYLLINKRSLTCLKNYIWTLLYLYSGIIKIVIFAWFSRHQCFDSMLFTLVPLLRSLQKGIVIISTYKATEHYNVCQFILNMYFLHYDFSIRCVDAATNFTQYKWYHFYSHLSILIVSLWKAMGNGTISASSRLLVYPRVHNLTLNVDLRIQIHLCSGHWLFR